jgi:transposase InsO family protein
VKLLTEQYPALAVVAFCTVFGKTRNAWYYHCKREQKQQMQDTIIVWLVNQIRTQQPHLGTRKLYHLLAPGLKQHAIKCGRDKLFNVLERYDLLVRFRKRKTITTDSNHRFYKYQNLIEHLTLNGKNQLWVSDITYITLRHGFAYLSLVTDAFSRKIIGYCLKENLSAQGPMEALDAALHNEHPTPASLIHHSDRGIQYCCHQYVERLLSHRIQISMSHRGDPYQNAIAERINGILKNEFGMNSAFAGLNEAQQTLDKAVDLYNHKRPHDSLNYLTPHQAHQLTGIIKRNWKNYNKNLCNAQQD